MPSDREVHIATSDRSLDAILRDVARATGLRWHLRGDDLVVVVPPQRTASFQVEVVAGDAVPGSAVELRAVPAPAEPPKLERCGAERITLAEHLAYACRRPIGHDGDHHPNPCGHDGCTGLECLRAAPGDERARAIEEAARVADAERDRHEDDAKVYAGQGTPTAAARALTRASACQDVAIRIRALGRVTPEST